VRNRPGQAARIQSGANRAALATQTEVQAGQVEQGFGQHPDAEIYLSQPGLGVILGARVLAEFGDDPDRYADAKGRKNYSGMSPITKASGTKRVVLARYARNRRLGDALFLQAYSALRASPGARAYRGAAKPIVGPMVIGQPTELDGGAQQIVANWVALKGQVAAQASKLDPRIPEPHYAGVYNVRGAPANTMRMWVGHRWNLADHQPGRAQIFDFSFMPVTNPLGRAPIPPQVKRYRQESGVFNGTIFQVGHFFALAFQHDWPGLQTQPTPGPRRSTPCRQFGPSVGPFTGHRPCPLTTSETCTR
jgi:hypothetical protein